MKGLEAVNTNFGEVGEKVVAAIVRRDKAKTLGVIEKFNGTSFHDGLHELINGNVNAKQHDSQGIDMETKQTNRVGNEASIDMALENLATPLYRVIPIESIF